ncbi:30S ribosomal protein S13 [Candidatus Micrarchaeota archaeon]|nr:30S ribosomal protein S13 [Candidatus Micrarchaeota archaeon]
MAKKKKDKKEKTSKKKEKKEKKPAAPKKQKKESKPERENFRGIVRLAGKDVGGELTLKRALLKVMGIGHTTSLVASRVIQDKLSIDPAQQVGEYTEEQIEKIDNILFNLQDHNVPPFMLNRCKDRTSGKDKHVIMNDLLFEVGQDIEREKKLYTWRGYRHAYGQKVRGQRTKNTGRSGMAVGVLRKSILAAQKGGAGKEKK